MSSTDTSPSTSTDTTIEPVVLTPLAATKILEVMGSQRELEADEYNLRLFVEGGGCGGPSFGIVFDKAADDDVHFDCEGVHILVDPLSLPHVAGAHVDFVETLEVTGFKVTAPNAQSGGCGSSSGGCGPSTCGASEAGTDACGSAPPAPSGGCGSGGCC